MVNILVGCTGSVATIKLPNLISALKENLGCEVEIRVVLTKSAKHFFSRDSLPGNVTIYEDFDDWSAWSKRGDPVLHIELGKWAEIFLIAPLDANTMAKIANGYCNNLLTCIVRAWDLEKTLIFCPAMNTRMYNHPLTSNQIILLESWGYKCIPVVKKTLMCGDTGIGAMAEISTIVAYVKEHIK